MRRWTPLCLSLVASVSFASDPKGPDLAKLKPQLDAICRGLDGRMGYSLILLNSGKRIDYRGDERFPTASTIKTAIALEAIRQVDKGERKMTDKMRVPDVADRKEWEASMWTYHMLERTSLDLDGWCTLMITVSDNLATRVVREWMGVLRINDSMASLGLKNTMNLSSFPKDNERLRKLNSQFGMGVTTPNEMARLLELVYQRKAASPEGCEKLIRWMSQQYWDDWIGSTTPLDVKVASKSGAISRSRSDTAIVFSPTEPYVLTIYTDNQKVRTWDESNPGHQAIVGIGYKVWNFLHPNRQVKPNKNYRDKFLPTGGGVEDG
jgi:beta-lactamase class A